MSDNYDPYRDPESDLYDPYADPDSPLYDPYLDPDAPWADDDAPSITDSHEECYKEEIEPGECVRHCTRITLDAAGNIEIEILEPEPTECDEALSS